MVVSAGNCTADIVKGTLIRPLSITQASLGKPLLQPPTAKDTAGRGTGVGLLASHGDDRKTSDLVERLQRMSHECLPSSL